MNQDINTSIQILKDRVKKFVQERDWEQYQSLKNISMDITREASELMEYFIWSDNTQSDAIYTKHKEKIDTEVVDVIFGLFLFCNRAHIDLTTAFEKKMLANEQKYPIEKCSGKNVKYTEL